MLEWLRDQYELYNRQLQRPNLSVKDLLWLQEKCQGLADEIDRLTRMVEDAACDSRE